VLQVSCPRPPIARPGMTTAWMLYMTQCLCACCCASLRLRVDCILARSLQTPCFCLARLHPLYPFLHVPDACLVSFRVLSISYVVHPRVMLFSCAMVPAICSLCDVYSSCPLFPSALTVSMCSLFRYAACICVFLCVVHSCVPAHSLCHGSCDLFAICFLCDGHPPC
jgi:hypothetical protein